MKNIRVVVEGKVQGVGYRAWVAERADDAGLTGWVRNRLDGSVEAVFAGPDAQVDGMVADLWDGPASARVEDVAVQDEDGSAPEGFRVLPTA